MTPEETLTEAAKQCGLHRRTLTDYLWNAKWSLDRLATEMADASWFDRLEEVLIAAFVQRSVRSIGPPGAVELTDARCRELISPKLRTAVDLYEGESVLALGKTGVGKTLCARLMARKIGRRWARATILESKGRLDSQYESHPSEEPSHLGVAWYSATDLALAVARHPLGKGAPEEVERARRSKLLVLDDLTWPQRDDTTLELLASRYDSGKPTIATAGCTRTELIAFR